MEYNYPKKLFWKWVVFYIIIGALAYGAAYYFFIVRVAAKYFK